MSLPVKKIYIDTKMKTFDSYSNSNFKWELPETVALPQNCIFFVDDICIPHSWYNIETGINDKIYMQVVNVLGTAAPTTNDCKIIVLTAGNYNLTTFANHLATIISAEFSGIPVSFTVVPNSNTNTLTITPKHSKLQSKNSIRL